MVLAVDDGFRRVQQKQDDTKPSNKTPAAAPVVTPERKAQIDQFNNDLKNKNYAETRSLELREGEHVVAKTRRSEDDGSDVERRASGNRRLSRRQYGRGRLDRKASELPERFLFAQSSDGKKIPVVKVIATTAGNRRTIREYGPEGQLLRSTIQMS